MEKISNLRGIPQYHNVVNKLVLCALRVGHFQPSSRGVVDRSKRFEDLLEGDEKILHFFLRGAEKFPLKSFKSVYFFLGRVKTL